MKELLQKKKSEKRVVKYVLRKYTVGVVSVAISASLISPAAAAVVQTSEEVGVTAVSRALPTDDEVQQIINEVIADLNNVEYEDLYYYLNPRVSGMDRLNVINELKKQLGTDPTEEQIQNGIKKLYMEKLDLKTSFNNVKGNLEDTLKRLLKNTDTPMARDIRNCKNQVLLGLTYLDKQYSFSFGSKSAKEIILYGSNFTEARNIYDLIAIGNLSYSDLELKNNVNTYNEKIKNYVGGYDIFTFIEKSIESYMPGKAPEEWLKEESKAWIVESNSTVGNSSLYKKMKKDTRLKSHLIPLLAVSENSIYAISTMSTVNYGLVDTYIEDKQNFNRDEFKSNLEQTAVKQQAF